MLKVSGFIGIECYDLILLLAQGMAAAGTDVAISDVSFDKSLEMSLFNEQGDIVSSICGFTYIPESQLDSYDGNDFLLIYLGRNTDKRYVNLCSDIFLVTDYQRHNVQFLKHLDLPNSAYVFLVMRYKVSSKITPEYVKYELAGLNISPDAIFVLEDGSQDLNNQILLQYNADKEVHKVSQSISNFIAAVMEGDFPDGAIKSIVKRLRR